MAAINIYVHDKTKEDPDGLCPNCSLPTLKTYVLERIDMTGITLVGERIACRDERVWVSDFVTYNKEPSK